MIARPVIVCRQSDVGILAMKMQLKKLRVAANAGDREAIAAMKSLGLAGSKGRIL